MKRILSILIILAMLLSLAACKQKEDDKKQDQPPTKTPPAEIDAPTINGVSILDYTVVIDKDGLDYDLRAAEYIRASLLSTLDADVEITADMIPIVYDSIPKADHEIVVGETSREISAELDEETEGLEFAIEVKDGSIALEGDYFIIAAAAYYLVDNLSASFPDAKIADGVTVSEPIVKEAKNLIMLIGDGMGVYQTKLHDYLEDVSDFSDGEDFFYGYLLPYQGFSRTTSFTGVTDSAAGGTALSTGYKTYNEYVGLDKNGSEIKNLTELAGELGKATAVMSTENKTGATPSTFSAHTSNRDNSDEILEDQLALATKYGTVIDCGYDYYTARYMRVIENHITDTLSALDADEDGFFLMYEEAHIDKKCHKNDIDGTFLALIRFNQAIARFMEYAFYNPDTMILITADHETGDLRPGEDGSLSYNREEHSGADVPIFAYGMGAESIDKKTVENIEIAKLFASLMGVESFGDPSDEWYDEIYG